MIFQRQACRPAIQSKFLAPFSCILFCILFCFPLVAFSLANQKDSLSLEIEARNHLKKSVDKILAAIQDPELAQDPKAQEKLLYARAIELFDFKTFSMLALGRKFRAFTNEQKELFVYYFSKLISHTYYGKLAGQDVQNITILYLENNLLPTKKNLFRTDISTQIVQGDTQIPVTYRMKKNRMKNSRMQKNKLQKNKHMNWKIYDIRVAGVSMAANYREQYRQQISKTPGAIIKELMEKVEK